MAGVTAAIYASRKKMDFVLLSKNFGGQLNMVGKVENFPFFKETNWKDLKQRLREQVDYLGIDFERVKVERIEETEGGFRVMTGDNEYDTRTVIVATGSEPRKLTVPGAAKFTGRGVEYSFVSDAPHFEGERVAVIGGGDSAMEATDFLLKFAEKIYVLNITEEIEAHESLMEVLENEHVEVINGAETTEIIGEDRVEGLKYIKDGRENGIEVSGVFPAIGMKPQTEFLESFLELNESGHVKVDSYCRTSVPGVFAAGDCTDVHEYQLTVAVGYGTVALLKAAEYLRRSET